MPDETFPPASECFRLYAPGGDVLIHPTGRLWRHGMEVEASSLSPTLRAQVAEKLKELREGKA